MAVTRKLAAIFYADVAGYSRLTGADEEGTHETLSSTLDSITAYIENFHGRVLHYAGDAILAEFSSVVSALSCAVEVQRDLETLNHNIPDDSKLQFRIGVNMGDVIVDRNELYGDGVNIAARLESLAEPGGICISGVVYGQVKTNAEFDFVPLGAQNFKNISSPVNAFYVRPKGMQPEQPENVFNPEASRAEDPLYYTWTSVISVLVVIAGITFAIWKYFNNPQLQL